MNFEHLQPRSPEPFEAVDWNLGLSHIEDPHLSSRLSPTPEISCSYCADPHESGVVAGNDFMTQLMIAINVRFLPDVDLQYHLMTGQFVAGQVWESHQVISEMLDRAIEDGPRYWVQEAATIAIGGYDARWVDNARIEFSDDTVTLDYEQFVDYVKHRVRNVFPTMNEHGSHESEPVMRLLEQISWATTPAADLVTAFPAGTSFFRGRLFEARPGAVWNTESLGAPPAQFARSGRMSAAGVSLFYCAEDEDTAVNEIAGHGAEPFAAIGEFVSTEELQILDLTRIPPAPSPFHPQARTLQQRVSFLSRFADVISRPVIPDDRQHYEYAPTQMLTEFFRWGTPTRIDGIAWRSPATRKRSYVIFADHDEFRDDTSGRLRLAADPVIVRVTRHASMARFDDQDVERISRGEAPTH